LFYIIPVNSISQYFLPVHGMGAAATAVGYIILPALCALMTCWASKMEMRMEGGAGWRGNTMLY